MGLAIKCVRVPYKPGSRSENGLKALVNRRKARSVGVALDLLKMLPVLDHSARRVVLFLHVIEAWGGWIRSHASFSVSGSRAVEQRLHLEPLRSIQSRVH